MKRSLIGVGLALAAGVGLVVACIPHPAEDYEAFLERTTEYRKKPPVEDSGPVDAQAPTQEIKGVYFGSCLSALSVGDLNKVLRFYTEVRFVPGAGGGKLDIEFTPLKGVDFATGQPVPTAPSAVSKSQVFGTPFGAKESPVDGAGVFEVGFAKVVIDKNANPISGREISIDNVFFKGRFSGGGEAPVADAGASTDAGAGEGGAGEGGTPAEAGPPADAGTPAPGAQARFCATLKGSVTSPIVQYLDPTENFCIFVPVKDGDPVPEIKREEYKCKL